MPRAAIRGIAILEPLTVFGLIMAYIWQLRYSYRGMWLGILAGVILSHIARREDAETLGFRKRNLRECLREFAPMLAFIALLMVACGLLLQTTRQLTPGEAFFSWAGYVPWGTFQQYLLNGYFLNRLTVAMPGRPAALASAVLFSGAHLPNWFLMVVTLLSGYVCARIYLRYRNLYFLGIAHATIGFLLLQVVPESVSHHLVIGPGWYDH
jgi:membrane protease YdiL (CAAX protease family)